MNDYASWLEANDRYLAGALAELRARLERAAQRHDTPPAAPMVTPWWIRQRAPILASGCTTSSPECAMLKPGPTMWRPMSKPSRPESRRILAL